MSTSMTQPVVPDQPATPVHAHAESRAPIFWGLVLIGAGLVFLALTLGWVPNPTGGAVGVAFAVAGFALLVAYVALHAHWWTLIAGPALLGIGAVILLPGGGSGAIFLGGIGLGFALIAMTNVERWWAVIPAGTMLTLAVITVAGPVIGGLQSGALLFFGLAATFGILAVIRVHGRTMRWPLYPAVGCLVFGALVATSGPLSAYFWPVLLVAAGVVLLAQGWIRRRP